MQKWCIGIYGKNDASDDGDNDDVADCEEHTMMCLIALKGC